MFVMADQIVAVAVDNVRGYIYWSDHGEHTISQSSLGSSATQVVVNAGKLCYVVSPLSGCVYFTLIKIRYTVL